MALPDIKDAGIMAGFVRWGWPWHGLCEGGAIGSSGKTITQPSGGDAWLIDKGLPALGLTAGEIAFEASAGREWRNYGMVSGGQVHGTDLPTRSIFGVPECSAFVHVDAIGENWLVELDYATFPSANTCTLHFSIVRFGHFQSGLGPQTPVTKTASVSCEAIELTNPVGGPFYFRDVSLHDVWTNGSKALFCVWIKTHVSEDHREVFSAIELAISGTGGADGSGLSLAATEAKGQSDLTTLVSNSGNYDPIQSGVMCGDAYRASVGAPLVVDCSVEVTWDQTLGFGGGYEAIVDYEASRTSCRFCRYDNAGNVQAFRLKSSQTRTHVPVSAVGAVIYGTAPSDYAEWSMVVEYRATTGWYLLMNDTEIDKIIRRQTQQIEQVFNVGFGYSGRQTTTTQGTSVYTWEGSLAASISSGVDWKYSGIYVDNDLSPGWRSSAPTGSTAVFLDDDSTVVGIWRTLNCAAFFLGDPTRSYGSIATPLGSKTSALTGNLYFAWQRKTGDFAFSGNPICYV